MTPLFSIVVPTLNRADTLRHVLPTLAAQSCPEGGVEILVCDGGSTDGTADVIADARLPKLRVIANAGGSRAAARNAGIRAAKGTFVLFNDADILAGPGLLAAHAAAHARHAASAIVGWEIQVASLQEMADVGDGRRVPGRLHPPWRRTLSWMFFLTGNASARRADLLRVGLFDETFTTYGHEDLELGYRLRRAGVRIRYEPRAVNYHWHPAQHPERLTKMAASGAATVRMFRKHRDSRILIGLGVNPVTWGLHEVVARWPAARAALASPSPRSGVARTLALQYAYLGGVKQAWRSREHRP